MEKKKKKDNYFLETVNYGSWSYKLLQEKKQQNKKTKKKPPKTATTQVFRRGKQEQVNKAKEFQ